MTNTLKAMKIGDIVEVTRGEVVVHILKVKKNSFYKVGSGERLWSGAVVLWMYKTGELFR